MTQFYSIIFINNVRKLWPGPGGLADDSAHGLGVRGLTPRKAERLADVEGVGPDQEPTDPVATGSAWGRENRGRRREPAGSIPPRSMASSA